MFAKQISNKSCRVKTEIYIENVINYKEKLYGLLAEEYSPMVEYFPQNQPKTNQNQRTTNMKRGKLSFTKYTLISTSPFLSSSTPPLFSCHMSVYAVKIMFCWIF